MVKLATQDKPFFSDNFAEKLTQIKAMGFDGFEADGGMLLNHYEELKAAVKATGVPVTSVCGGYRGWIGDFVDYRRRTAVEDITIILERGRRAWRQRHCCSRRNGGMFSLRLPPHVPPRPADEDTAVLIDTLSKLEGVCAKSGTTVLLEPLKPL